MDIIPSISSKSLTKDTAFYNYLLNVDAYSKIPKLYGMENIKLDISQEISGKVDEFVWWDMDGIKPTLARILPPRSFRKAFLYVEYDFH